MRRLLDRYVATECLPPFGLSLGVFTFVLLMQRLLKLSDLVVAKGVPVAEVLLLLGLALPAVLPLLLPVSLLLAVLLAFGRLSADSEITAMRACGVGLGRNIRPVVALSFAVFCLTAAVSLWVQPYATRSLKQSLYQILKNRISVMAEAGTFIEITSGVTLYANRLDRESGELLNLFLHLDRPPARDFWILASRGSIREEARNLVLDLEGGELHQSQGAEGPYRRLFFDRYRIAVPLPSVTGDDPESEEMPTAEVIRRARQGEPGKERRVARMELHRRLALPASCLVFGILGATLGLHHTRAGRSRSLTVCLALLVAYYALLTAGQAMGDRGKWPPALAAWLPNLTLGALAAYAFVRKNREAPLPFEEFLVRAAGRLRRLLPAPRSSP